MKTYHPTEVRLRTRIHPDDLAEMVGKLPTASAYDVLAVGPTAFFLASGQPLAYYLPGAISPKTREAVYPILTRIREDTHNRGKASGSKTIRVRNQTYSATVLSSILGAFEPQKKRFPVCRLTAWTGKHLPEFRALHPLFTEMAAYFAHFEPRRYRAQVEQCRQTHPDWIIKDTPYSTITVNNSYSTGTHQDQGDLAEGFSCLAVLRRGTYTGGVLTFPEYRVGIDMQDGDLVLMDAHAQWHANTQIVCACQKALSRPCKECGAERISVVAYYRTNLVRCESAQAEIEKAQKMIG